MNIFKKIYYRLKYPSFCKAYTNLVCDPTDLSSEGNWEACPDTKMVFEGESLTIGSHEEPQQTTFESLAFYDCEHPDNIDFKNEKELDAFFKKHEPVMEQKKNQQGKMFTKYRINRYAKNSRMYKKEV